MQLLAKRLTVLASIPLLQTSRRRLSMEVKTCMIDEQHMRLALQEARRAFDRGEVPIGAVLVQQGRVISTGHNRVEGLSDASAHAEVLCLRSAAMKLGTWRLTNTVRVTTIKLQHP